MKQEGLYELFLDLIKDLFDVESQTIQKLPSFVDAATDERLKQALNRHLEETRLQLERLKEILKMLAENQAGDRCSTTQQLFEEGKKGLKLNWPPSVRDAEIIIACQKLEHYEIASYGSARTLARHLNEVVTEKGIDFDEISDFLEQSLEEECAMDEILTDLAEGGFFSTGINEIAEKDFSNTLSEKITENKPLE